MYRIVSCNIVSYHVMSYHIMSHRIILYHIKLYYIISYHLILYCIISYHIKLCHIISPHIILYHTTHIIPYHIVSLISYHLKSSHLIQFDLFYGSFYAPYRLETVKILKHNLRTYVTRRWIRHSSVRNFFFLSMKELRMNLGYTV